MPPRYEIRVSGCLGDTMQSAFPALSATPDERSSQTVLTGYLDSAALYGVLAELERLGIDLIEIRRDEGESHG